jgi:hypothetical protein
MQRYFTVVTEIFRSLRTPRIYELCSPMNYPRVQVEDLPIFLARQLRERTLAAAPENECAGRRKPL